MRPKDYGRAQELESSLLAYDRDIRPLLGIRDPARRASLIEQLLESIRRVGYVSVVRARNLGLRFLDPRDELFDPLKAAIMRQRQGDIEEAFWLVFLFVHFGKNRRAGWRYLRDVYGRLGGRRLWNWAAVSASPSSFRRWLGAHQEELRHGAGPRGFGNHRKYQSLDAYSPTGTGAAVESYVRWVGPPRTHEELFEDALRESNRNSRRAFDHLYQSMNAVVSFGRTARFDYLTMVGKLELAPIEPGSTYMQGATGPVSGARLLFGGDHSARLSRATLDSWLVELDAQMQVGMQVLEDALCNWQKSPDEFMPFRG